MAFRDVNSSRDIKEMDQILKERSRHDTLILNRETNHKALKSEIVHFEYIIWFIYDIQCNLII